MDPSPPQWYMDLKTPPAPKPKAANIPDPPGFSAATKRSVSKRAAQKATPEELDVLKVKKSWEIALAPAKSLPMNAIMMYMSGNSLQIFSIMMVFMLFKTPIQSLLQTNQAFARFETEGTKQKLLLVKAAYVLMNLVALSFGLWKVNSMGLFP